MQHYTISVPCDAQGTVVSWAMHDDGDTAIRAAREIIAHHKPWQAAETAETGVSTIDVQSTIAVGFSVAESLRSVSAPDASLARALAAGETSTRDSDGPAAAAAAAPGRGAYS